MAVYIAFLRKDPSSDFGVDFPDFPGCVTAGATIEEAVSMATEALEGHIAVMVDEGLDVPEPSLLEPVLADPDNKGALPFLVPVEIPSKPVRVNVIIPGRALRAIDAYAEQHGMTRSGFLVKAAESAIHSGIR